MTQSSEKIEIISLLNEVLCAELTAINQYFLHAKLCDSWGYSALAKNARSQSIGEMKHAELLTDRILFLEGMPNLQRLGKVLVGESVTEQMKLDKNLEEEAITRLNQGINLCHKLNDHGTRLMLEEILASEEEHVDWLNTQLELIGALGEKQYLSQKL